MMEYWNIGMMECWNDGMMGCWVYSVYRVESL